MPPDFTVRFLDLDAVIVDLKRLSADERTRVARKATPALRQRQAASFLCLRQTLSEALRRAPEDLVFRLSKSGKPRLASGELQFSVSHSEGVGMLAWGERELGADVEARMTRPNDALATKILTPTEREVWQSLPQPQQSAWLTRVWTRKEAALKAHGSGLRVAPRTLEVGLAASMNDDSWAVDLGGRRWQGRDWYADVPDGYFAAVCVEVCDV